ncbi:MAG: hypothetical protein JO212_19110 [Acetobacteraceae bacterium]|nr:hypothetical protein [Acetobacteraceae bacterium]MBV8592134.1 hypothetical protein [Acetobacteraceae bacterium]
MAKRRPKPSPWPWLDLTLSATMLALEAQQVIALRLAGQARRGAQARREAVRMVTEKIGALAEAQRVLASRSKRGSAGQAAKAKKVVSLYRKRVSANRRRLTKI